MPDWLQQHGVPSAALTEGAVRVLSVGTPSRGSSAVELAISLPFLCLLILGVADIGRAFYYREAVANAGRQALRVAMSQSQQTTGNTVCAGSAGKASSSVPASGGAIAIIVNDAAVESSSNGTPSGSVIAGATVRVTWHCSGGTAVANSTNGGVTDPALAQSDAIEVTVSYPMTVITPFAQQVVGGTVPVKVDVFGRAQY
jgi:Flp pilus assembly protein TadG